MKKAICNILPILAIALVIAAVSGIASAQNDAYTVNYFSNNVGAAPDATVHIANVNTDGDDLCANIYVFDEMQEMNACCSCFVSHNGLRTLSVKTDLTSRPLTGPSTAAVQGTIQIISSPAPAGACPLNTAANYTITEPELEVWATHIQNPVKGVYPITETQSLEEEFNPVGADVRIGTTLATLEQTCAFVQFLGSKKGGICSCGTGD